MLGRQLRTGTYKKEESRAGLVRFPLFWNSHCNLRHSIIILNDVTGSYRGLIAPILYSAFIPLGLPYYSR